MVFKNLRIAALAVLIILLYTNNGYGQRKSNIVVNTGTARMQWVDSIYNRLTEEEHIGQLFMVAAYSGGKGYNEEAITKLINNHQIGGLIFMQGGPVRQAMLTNKYQQLAQVPLLIAMDAEWGLGMRLDSVKDFPRQMMLGATRDTSLAYHMGMAIAYQCRRVGVHIDFAPVVDVNNNPANPIINSRSFGEDKTRVARMGIAYMRGLQDNGVIACAKHFPGHGDTNVDSHKDLPVINKSLSQLDTLELYPFKQLIKAGVKSIMVAHLEVPALETEPHVPTTLSKNTVTNLLKNQLGYKGLIFTDALNMQGVAKYFPPGDADLRAFIAGNDVLLFAQDVPAAINKIKSALDSNIVTQADLETRVKKILSAKYDAGLSNYKAIDTTNITNDLNQYTYPMRDQIAKAAVTLVRDDNSILGKINTNAHIGYIGINASEPTELYKGLQNNYINATATCLPKGSPIKNDSLLMNGIDASDATIVAIHNISFTPANHYGIDTNALAFLQKMQGKSNVMVVLLGNAYAMQSVCAAKSILVSYEDDSITENAVAQVLLRQIKAKGKLPVTPACGGQNMNTSSNIIALPPAKTITYQLTKTDLVADAGVTNNTALDNLNMFLQRSISDGAFPGCRILAAKNGKVFYDKALGYQTYSKEKRIDSNTLYDIASCTKVMATTLAVMRLYENGKLDLNKTLGDYLPMVKNTDKAGLVIRDVLLHQAGLKSWVPFYKETLDAAGNLRTDLYKQEKSKKYSIEVAKNLYLRNTYEDTIWNRILTSPLENKGKYVYSDLDFYFLAEVVKEITGDRIDEYVYNEFYKPLGLIHITYKPLDNGYDISNIAPTENDLTFRHEQIQGYVHDQGAALLGGVAGHAGIFATAGDVAVILQMLLNKGMYNGTRYFKPETIDYFTAYNSSLSRRGLGFDKPSADADDGGPAGERCSGYAFGHQGFTGTCVWADPATGVVFVFLSNRVYPSADNSKINHLSVRTVAQDYIYESLGLPVNHDREKVYQQQIGSKHN